MDDINAMFKITLSNNNITLETGFFLIINSRFRPINTAWLI